MTLLPCPFCGGDARFSAVRNLDLNVHCDVTIKCNICGLKLPYRVCHDDDVSGAKEEFTNKWNTRYTPEVPNPADTLQNDEYNEASKHDDFTGEK